MALPPNPLRQLWPIRYDCYTADAKMQPSYTAQYAAAVYAGVFGGPLGGTGGARGEG